MSDEDDEGIHGVPQVQSNLAQVEDFFIPLALLKGHKRANKIIKGICFGTYTEDKYIF